MTEKALVLSASGVRLVYEIGVLKYLVTNLPVNCTDWSYVYGSSGGALLATFICQYPIGQEKQAVLDLEKLVSGYIGDNGMRSFFPFGSLQGLLWHKALHSPSFLEEMITQHIDEKKVATSGRQLRIIAIDYADGEGKEFTEKCEGIHDFTIGSCSIPLVFPPRKIVDLSSPTGYTYLGDGGVTDFIPIQRAALNPKIGFIDAILSVGSKEARIIPLCEKGSYPNINNIIGSLVESFYKFSADNAEEVITSINMRVLMKSIMGTKIDVGMPETEKQRIEKSLKTLERTTFVECRIFRPSTPFVLSTTGENETINKTLYDSGIETATRTLSLESGSKSSIQRNIVL